MKALIRKAQKGDKQAFTELVALNRQSMYKVARAYFSEPMDIDDALSETVLHCWKSISRLKDPSRFKTWLIRILINCCNDQLKAAQKCVSIEGLDDSRLPCVGQEHSGVADIIDMADERYRPVLMLYYGEGFRAREISDITGLPIGTVTSHLKRGREQLAQKLADEGVIKL